MSDQTPSEKPPEGSPERRAHDMAQEILTGGIKPYWRKIIRQSIDQRDAAESPPQGSRASGDKAIGGLARR